MKKAGIRAVTHTTAELGSDHLAYVVGFIIVNDSAVTRIKAAAINLGPARVSHVLGVLLPPLGRHGIVVITEAGGQTDLIEEYAEAYGWRILGRTGPAGAASTIVLVGPGIRTQKTLLRRLLRRVNVGPGAGPSVNKVKWWNGGRVESNGVVFGVSAVHFLASQQHHRRFAYSLRMARLLTAITVDRRVPWLVGGDWNSDMGGKRVEPLAKWMLGHGWVTSQQALGPLATHGRRAIDGFAWRRGDDLRSR